MVSVSETWTFVYFLIHLCSVELLIHNQPIAYAQKVGELTNMLGAGHILVQRYGDILDGKRTWAKELASQEMLEQADTLKDMNLPKGTLVMIVKRGDEYLIPNGTLKLHAGDKLLLISENSKE